MSTVPVIEVAPWLMFVRKDDPDRRPLLRLDNAGAVRSGRTLWCADWETGKTIHPVADSLVPTREQPEGWGAVLDRIVGWAAGGSADAAWWLAWWYEGSFPAKSVWYFIAALRLDTRGYHSLTDVQFSNAIHGAGTCWPPPRWDIRFMHAIPEFRTGVVDSNWKDAIRNAEDAVAALATKEQVDEALRCLRYKPTMPFGRECFRVEMEVPGAMARLGPASPRRAAYAAGMTELGLTTHPRYIRWRENYVAREQRQLEHAAQDRPGARNSMPVLKRLRRGD